MMPRRGIARGALPRRAAVAGALSVVMPREGGASSNPCAAIEAEAVPCRKAGNDWIVRFRGR